jgi:hypothetical protein
LAAGPALPHALEVASVLDGARDPCRRRRGDPDRSVWPAAMTAPERLQLAATLLQAVSIAVAAIFASLGLRCVCYEMDMTYWVESGRW